MALAPQCEKQCKYKYDKSSADIRIGDLWGSTYKDDQKGVSALVVFTEKGRKVIEGLEGVTLVEHPFGMVAEGQMKRNAKAHPLRQYIIKKLKKKGTIDSKLKVIIDGALLCRRIYKLIANPRRTFCNAINKIRK